MGNNTSISPSDDEIKIDNRKKYRDQANPNKSSSKLFEANYIPVTIFHDQGSQTGTKKEIKQKQPMHTKFIKFVILAFVLYLIFVISFATSSFCQGLLLYLNIARIPLGDLTDLSSFGLLGARNINFTTEDGLTLKGYHLLPSSQVQDLIQKNQYSSADFDELLANANNIIMYFHGNGATRAMSMRLEVIKKLATFTDSHVITFDYRGFGDSPGWPSELGTFLDAKAAIHWVDSVVKKYNPDAHGYFPADELFEKKNNKKNTILSLFNRIFHPTLSKTNDNHNSAPLSTNQTCHTGNVTQPKLFLYGHSLGTGILMPVAVAFNKANKNAISGVILDCPFTSIKAATNDHPSTTIFRIVPYFRELINKLLKYQYASEEIISQINAPILIVHGEQDFDLPVHHSKQLQSVLLSSGKYFSCKYGESCEIASDNNSLPFQLSIIPEANHNSGHRYMPWIESIVKFMHYFDKK